MSPAPEGRLRGCPEPLARRYDVALLDLDGVAYVGPRPVPGAAEALAAAAAQGMRRAFVTNNASRTPQTIADHLNELGIPASPEEIVTSAQAAVRLLAGRLPTGSPVLVVGTDALAAEVRAAGLRPVGGADDRPAAVVQGYDPTLDYPRLTEATLAVAAGAWWIAANADATMPSPRGQLPGNGALVALVATATGRTPTVAGKPELPLHREAVRRSGARHPLVVGDRLDTDIEGAVRAGTDALLVLTGVTDPAHLLGAAPEHRPSYLAADLHGLLSPHPQVEVDRDVARCGRWRATVEGDSLRVDVRGDGSAPPGEGCDDGCDALRAACSAAWSAADGGQPPSRVVAPVEAGLPERLSAGR